MHLFSRSACIVFCLWALCSCQRELVRPVTGTVLALQRSVELRNPGTPSMALTLHSRIAPGAGIATGAGSRADLLLLPGLLVELGAKTEIDLIDLRFLKDGDDASEATTRVRTARLRLTKGRLTAFVLPTRNRKTEYWLEVEAGKETLRGDNGSLFLVHTGPEETSATCAQGTVSVSPPGGILDAGHQFVWRTGQASSGLVSPEEAQPQELTAALLAGYRLQRLQLRLRDTVPDWRRTP